MLKHFDVVQAHRQVRGRNLMALGPRQSLAGWPAMQAALLGLAYYPGAADHWLRLGIAPQVGPAPSEGMIDQ